MFKKEICSILSFYAVSPIHAGSGASVATVDLPIQREKHTNYPIIQASGVKGAMRDHFRKFYEEQNNEEENDKPDQQKQQDKVINYIFGSDKQDKPDGANKDEDIENKPGAISVSDAKILAFPMRSNVTPFVWVTCPTVLERFNRDLKYIGINSGLEFDFDLVKKDGAAALIGDNFSSGDKIILEDALVEIMKKAEENLNVKFIEKNFKEITRLLLISDEMFDYCVSYCTEIQTNIKIDSGKGTTKDGSLRYQEFLPADTVLYSIVYFSNPVNSWVAETIKNYIQENIKDFLQVGGDVTLGKGICKINWIENNDK